jgi:hypothetical protein
MSAGITDHIWTMLELFSRAVFKHPWGRSLLFGAHEWNSPTKELLATYLIDFQLPTLCRPSPCGWLADELGQYAEVVGCARTRVLLTWMENLASCCGQLPKLKPGSADSQLHRPLDE